MSFHNHPLGFIGTGNMGMGMVQRWLGQGGIAHICDTDAQRQEQGRSMGAQVHATPASVVEALGKGGLLIVTVVTAEQVRDVLWGTHGAVSHLQPGHTVMLCPTISPEDCQDVGEQLLKLGVNCIDAPMSGGPVRAASGQMSLMVATPMSVLTAHEAVLHALADPVFHVSERVGDGARTKLVNNLLAGIQLVGNAEVLVLAERMGLNLQTTLAVIAQSSAQSWIGSNRMSRALNQAKDVQAHMSLLSKDTRLAMQAAQSVGLKPLLGDLAAHTFAQALDAGWANLDDSAMLDWLRQRYDEPEGPHL